MEDQSANYIPLKEAALLCEYSQEYLNLLVRKGKLKAMKIGRNWVTKKEWLAKYLENNWHGEKKIFITLKEAALLCDYSQDYLNLLVRKEKIRALKIGRNWVTKKEWIQEYLTAIERKKAGVLERSEVRAAMAADSVAKSLIAESAICGQISGGQIEKKETLATVEIARAEEKTKDIFPLPLPPRRFIFFKKSIVLMAGCVALCTVLFGAIFLVKSGIFSSSNNRFSEKAGSLWELSGQEIRSYEAKASLVDAFGAAGKMIASAKDNLFAGFGVAGGKIAGFMGYLVHGKTEVVAVNEVPAAAPVNKTVLEKSTDVLEKNLVENTHDQVDNFRKEFNLPTEGSNTGTTQGLVVAPASGDIDKQKQAIKDNFSDQVAVRPIDDTSGIIVPQFKDKNGEDYLYMMVPINRPPEGAAR